MLFAANAQDRGAAPDRAPRGRLGDGPVPPARRRAGAGRLRAALRAPSRCGYEQVRQSRGHPVVFLARGSHAAYFAPGVRDRMFPDPNDEADGRGRRVRPAARPDHGGVAAVDALRRPLGRVARGLGPGRDELTARPGVPAPGPLVGPGGLGRARRGRARGATATSAASATGARRSWRPCSPCWGSSSRSGSGCGGRGCWAPANVNPSIEEAGSGGAGSARGVEALPPRSVAP